MKIKVRYLVEIPGAAGKPPRWYWQPSAELRAQGWRPCRLRRADGAVASTLDEAVDAAKKLNADLDAWRRGGADTPAAPPQPAKVDADSIAHVIRLYKTHRRYLALADKTRKDYAHHLMRIEEWAGDAPIRAITRPIVQDYYESLMATGRLAAANARLRVLRLLLQFGVDQGFAEANPAEKPGMVGTAPRLRVWTDPEIAAFTTAADAAGHPGVADAVILAIATGQRQGDLLALPALALAPDGAGGYRLHLKQSKRGARIQLPIPAGTPAALRIAAAQLRRDQVNAKRADKKQTLITTALWNDSTGAKWSDHTFRHVFADLRAIAIKRCPSIADVTFQDCRDTALTRLAEAGCTIPEICAVSGHSEQGAVQVLKHYLALNTEMADSAIGKLLAHQDRKAKHGA